jgi:hypothetical protein
MRDYRDAKAMAQTLRDALKQKSVSITHSESLELIAKILGFHDWNVLSATIQSAQNPTPIRITTADDRPPVPLPEGTDLAVVPIRDIVLFPHMIAPLFVGREKTRVDRAQAETLARTVVERFQAYLNIDFALLPYSRLPHIREPGVLADAISPLLPIEISQRQELLETGDAVARLEKILALMKNDRRAA